MSDPRLLPFEEPDEEEEGEEGGHVHDDESPFCPSVNGLGPHNYVPYLNILDGSQWLVCSQCGDAFEFIAAPQQTQPVTPATPATPAPGQRPIPFP